MQVEAHIQTLVLWNKSWKLNHCSSSVRVNWLLRFVMNCITNLLNARIPYIPFLLPGSKKTIALSAAYSLSSIWISWKGWTSSSRTRLATLHISGTGLFLWITQSLPAGKTKYWSVAVLKGVEREWKVCGCVLWQGGGNSFSLESKISWIF